MDFTDLNKACPKDCYPLPRIDALVDSTVGHEVFCFLDAFKGYHQIGMDEEDQQKTAFVTDQGVFCYVTMPFGLKNAGATYQRLVNTIFKHQIGRNMEAYVDDLLVKSKKQDLLVTDLSEVFGVLRTSRMRLNPKKCTFGVSSGKFLGFMISENGIHANPDKVQAIRNMTPPKTLRDVQRLTGRLAALHRFLSRSAHRSIPFFKTLKKADQFSWTEDCQKAFEDLREHLLTLPTLASPTQGETLFLYLSATTEAASAVLVKDELGTQRPVYYVSRALQGPEQRYTRMERLVLSLVHAARRLKAYFQSHPICVLTDQPLRQVMNRPEASGRLTKWAVELGEFDIEYRPRTAIKGQALADFIAEQTPGEDCVPEVSTSAQWDLYVDGSSNEDGSGAGLLLISPEGFECSYALRFNFPASNNEAEYEALITGLSLARRLGVVRLKVHSDSQLVVKQVLGEYEAKEDSMKKYLARVGLLMKDFDSFEIQRIPRSKNKRADALSKLASTSYTPTSGTVTVEILHRPSLDGAEVLPISETSSWMSPYIAYLSTGELPADRAVARRIRLRAARYALHQDNLYRRSYLGPWLRCITPEEGQTVLREIHEGLCGSHVGPRTMSRKALHLGYYWPSMQQDSQALVRSCATCQAHGPDRHLPTGNLVPISSPWPFEQWGTDLLGPFPRAPGSLQWLVVAIDYFSKWVEAEPLTRITGLAVQKFFWKQIICRFGIPRVIISDNGKQFAENPFKAWCRDLGITQHFTSVGHPQANGQAENLNRTLLHGLKTRLDRLHTSWVDELPSVLWSYRTTSRTATQETPFSLTYGSEAVIPAEVLIPSPRMQSFSDPSNQQARRTDLDFLEERRDIAAIRSADYKNSLARYYNQRVREVTFQPGDLVLRKNSVSRAQGQGKLDAKWEGPYRVIEAHPHGYCTLAYRDGSRLPRTWHFSNLKRFYV